MKKALLLLNVGSPKQATVPEVRRFLSEFLNDGRVIDIPWLFRKILVNLIIVPFRSGKSTKLYKRLFTSGDSPLIRYLFKLTEKVQDKLIDKYTVYPAVRYGQPSVIRQFQQAVKENADEIIILPLYPQYASSTTGSVSEQIYELTKKWQVVPQITIINQFYDHPAFIKAFVSRIREYKLQQYDHIVFSYHGLPIRHIQKIHPERDCETCACTHEMPDDGKWCYKATCYATTRLLARGLNIPADKYSIGFQSRLSMKWLKPFTDQLIIDLAHHGKRKILVIAPSFVADCLETTIEIESDYRSLFLQHGGTELDMVQSLNDSDEWVRAIQEIIL
jgi:ferrochelatase